MHCRDILLSIQQYLTDVAMTCFSLRLRRCFRFLCCFHYLWYGVYFQCYIVVKGRVAWAEGPAGEIFVLVPQPRLPQHPATVIGFEKITLLINGFLLQDA